MAFQGTKAAISLKRVKMEKTLVWRAYRNSPTLFRTVPSRPPMASSSSRLGVCNLVTPSYLSNRESYRATDFKFVGYIYRANPNNSPLKVLESRERWLIQGLPYFWVPPIISGTGKATDFKICRNIHRVDRNKNS